MKKAMSPTTESCVESIGHAFIGVSLLQHQLADAALKRFGASDERLLIEALAKELQTLEILAGQAHADLQLAKQQALDAMMELQKRDN